eukprot:tig00021042_g17603.t1
MQWSRARRKCESALLFTSLLLCLVLPSLGVPGASTVVASGVAAPRDLAYCRRLKMLLVTAGVGGERIDRVMVDTGVVSTVVGVSGTSGYVDAVGTSARINSDGGMIVFDPLCTYAYLGDSANHRVRRIRVSDYAVMTLAGSGANANSDGYGTAAALANPRGLAVSSEGRYLYVSTLHAIRRVDLQTGYVSTVAGGGAAGGADLVGASASFSNPAGLARLDDETLLVVEEGGHTLRRLNTTSGQVTTLAGLYATPGSTDGLGAAARLNTPHAVACHAPTGLVFVTQPPVSSPHVRKVQLPSGDVASLSFSGPVATETSLVALVFDPRRGRAFATGYNTGAIYAVEVPLPAAAACGAASCVAVGAGSVSLAGAGVLQVS